MDGFLSFLKARARERTTWLGLVSVLSALGIGLSPEQADAVVALGIAAGGLVLTFFPEKGVPDGE
jgi:hypothetical protein